MLGQTLDYYLLRLLAHDRLRATIEELKNSKPRFDPELALRRVSKFKRRVDNRLPLDRNLSYLDVGCGTGDMSLGFVLAGAGRVTGIDIEPIAVDHARANAAEAGLQDRVEFVCADINTWTASTKFDIVVSHEALEHIHSPDRFLHRIGDFVKPDGHVILGFGPLFHSPVGDHMGALYRIPMPWRGVLFSEAAILRVRREVFRPSESPKHYAEISGGMNRMRYHEFLKFAAADYDFELLCINPQLKRIPPLYFISNVVTKIPVLQDYTATSVYAILKRRAAISAGKASGRALAKASGAS